MAIRVLIVDDHPLTRDALAGLLMQHGFDVAGHAADGEEAVQVARRLQPELVLLDLSMPGVDGLQALPALRSAVPGLGIVVLSGFDRGRMEARALELGADRYLEKRASLAEVRGTVQAVMAERAAV